MIFAYGSNIKICGRVHCIDSGPKRCNNSAKKQLQNKNIDEEGKGKPQKSSFLSGRATNRGGGLKDLRLRK